MRPPALNQVIYWVRSISSRGVDLVPMYYKGRLAHDSNEGSRGDIRGRPRHLGPGSYTGVFSPDDFVDVEGQRVDFGNRSRRSRRRA